MPTINTPINGHSELTTFTWALNLLAQPRTGEGSAVATGEGAKHYQVSLDAIRALLVEAANVENNITTEIPGKVLDARQGNALRILISSVAAGVLWQDQVIAVSNTPPALPTDGDRYIVGTAPTGVWAGHAGDVAVYATDAWAFATPSDRWGVFVYNDNQFLLYHEGSWTVLADLDRITDILHEAETARDAILENAGFIAVSTDLLGSDHIGTVANDLLLGASSLVKKVADSIANVNAVGNSIANVNSVAAALLVISAVNNNKTNINTVAGDITNVNAVAGNKTNIDAVAATTTEITALAGKIVEIAALYDELDQIALKENTSNKKSTLAENSEAFFPNQKAVNDGLATKITRPTSTDKAIPRFSGTSGDLQNSGVTIDDSGNITPAGIFLGGASSANLLDDYEEGTWNPVLRGLATPGTFTFTTAYGEYYKIGNFVTVFITIYGATLANASGELLITGAPFAMSGDVDRISLGSFLRMHGMDNVDLGELLFGFISFGGSFIYIRKQTNQTYLNYDASNVTNANIAFSITYRVY